jgi:hypothetical protein
VGLLQGLVVLMFHHMELDHLIIGFLQELQLIDQQEDTLDQEAAQVLYQLCLAQTQAPIELHELEEALAQMEVVKTSMLITITHHQIE